jgi:hypothetical protein
LGKIAVVKLPARRAGVRAPFFECEKSAGRWREILPSIAVNPTPFGNQRKLACRSRHHFKQKGPADEMPAGLFFSGRAD